ncbi:MAG: GNAT family N-acetyltransferase, partial [Acidobacteria bacterium]|nr:GNAT family N-acetyltransferase [Acidobacteriota bacterium]
ERDAAEATALVRQNLAHLKEWLPWATDNFSVEDSLEFIRRNRRQFAENQGYAVHILYRGQHAGNIGYNHIDWTHRTTQLGYWLAASFQGKGIMTRACRAVVDYAFREFKLNRVDIHCGLGNAKSRAIPERLGFKQEGVFRQAEWVRDHFNDLAVYAMLAEEWRELNEK